MTTTCEVKWCACLPKKGSKLCAAHATFTGDVDLIAKVSYPPQPDVAGEGERFFRHLDDVNGKTEPDSCKRCNGSGKCGTCGGSGSVSCECSCGDYHDRDCSVCDGGGECERCDGKGRIE